MRDMKKVIIFFLCSILFVLLIQISSAQCPSQKTLPPGVGYIMVIAKYCKVDTAEICSYTSSALVPDEVKNNPSLYVDISHVSCTHGSSIGTWGVVSGGCIDCCSDSCTENDKCYSDGTVYLNQYCDAGTWRNGDYSQTVCDLIISGSGRTPGTPSYLDITYECCGDNTADEGFVTPDGRWLCAKVSNAWTWLSASDQAFKIHTIDPVVDDVEEINPKSNNLFNNILNFIKNIFN